MQDSTTREKVLKKIRKSLIEKTNPPFHEIDLENNLFEPITEDPEIYFAQKLTEAGGHFVYCNDRFDFAGHLVSLGQERKWKNVVCLEARLGDFLKECEYPFITSTGYYQATDALITTCECLVARSGSILLSSKQLHGRRFPAIANTLLVVAWPDQLVGEVKDALHLIKKNFPGSLPSMLTFITGPSKTADIELTSVTGAHGPADVFVFLLDDSVG